MKVVVVFCLLSLAISGLAQTLCETPNGETGRCIPFHRCQIFLKALRGNRVPSSELRRFLFESQCGGYGSDTWVCCGSVAQFQPLQTITRFPPSTTTTTRRPTQIQLSQQYRGLPADSNGDPRAHRNFNLLPSRAQCGSDRVTKKIFGGNDTALYEFPWMAILEYEKNGQNRGFGCGGILINSRYVLTAAHCVTGAVTDQLGNMFRVRLGEHDLRTPIDCQLLEEGDEVEEDCAAPHQDITVEEIISHPDYNLNGQEYNDIALVRLSRPASPNSNVEPICLPLNRETSAPGNELFVAGWGRTNQTNWQSNIKQKTKVPVVPFDGCRTTYARASRRLIDTQFCAGGLFGIDSCSGDSGGPLMTTIPGAVPVKWYVEGLVSYGPTRCGTQGWPGIYTKVSSYMNWILDNMRS